MDYTLLLIVVLLVVIGLVILYSTSAYNGQVKFHDSFYYLKKQAFATVLGIVLMLFVAGMDYHIWQRLAVFGYLAAVALSVAVMLFGREINGSKRWLALGPFSFQPSEFAKVALILFLADLVTKNVKTIGKMWTLCRIMFWILPIVGLVGASNLSTAIIILGIGVILIFVASPKYAQFALMGIAGACFMGIFLALESYRLERLAIWRNPEKYEKGYQTLQGLYAIGSGGVFGVGIGNGCCVIELRLEGVADSFHAKETATEINELFVTEDLCPLKRRVEGAVADFRLLGLHLLVLLIRQDAGFFDRLEKLCHTV